MGTSGAERREIADAVEASVELVAVARRWIKALETKDSDVLTAMFSNSDSLRYVGSDPDEILEGKGFRARRCRMGDLAWGISLCRK